MPVALTPRQRTHAPAPARPKPPLPRPCPTRDLRHAARPVDPHVRAATQQPPRRCVEIPPLSRPPAAIPRAGPVVAHAPKIPQRSPAPLCPAPPRNRQLQTLIRLARQRGPALDDPRAPVAFRAPPETHPPSHEPHQGSTSRKPHSHDLVLELVLFHGPAPATSTIDAQPWRFSHSRDSLTSRSPRKTPRQHAEKPASHARTTTWIPPRRKIPCDLESLPPLARLQSFPRVSQFCSAPRCVG